MPRGRGRGGRHGTKKGAASGKRELVYKEEGQEYGQVLKLLGSGRMEVSCFDGKVPAQAVIGREESVIGQRRTWYRS